MTTETTEDRGLLTNKWFQLSVGLLWTLLTHWATQQWSAVIFAFYRRPALILPSNVLGWILTVVFFKIYAAVFFVVLAIAMPMTMLVAGVGHGIAFATGMLALGGTLAWLIPAQDREWAIAAFVLAQIILLAAQGVAGRLSRLTWFRPAG